MFTRNHIVLSIATPNVYIIIFDKKNANITQAEGKLIFDIRTSPTLESPINDAKVCIRGVQRVGWVTPKFSRNYQILQIFDVKRRANTIRRY